jgi:hypothetical protein
MARGNPLQIINVVIKGGIGEAALPTKIEP